MKIGKAGVLAVSVFVLVMIFLLAIFGLYYRNLGSISPHPEDWGAFGSLLSGAFTLIAAMAALATFVYTQIQLKQLSILQSEQHKSLVFDRFYKHRDLFFKRCSEIEVQLDNRIEYYDPGNLYLSLFSENSPSHVDYEASESGKDNLRSLWRLIAELEGYLSDLAKSNKRSPEFFVSAARISGGLKLKSQTQSVLGRLVYIDGGESLVVGLYDLCGFHADLHTALKEISSFASLDFTPGNLTTKSRAQIVSLIRKDINSLRGRAGVKFDEGTDVLDRLHGIFDSLSRKASLDGVDGEIVRSLVVRLSDAFDSSAKVEQYLTSAAALQDAKEFERLGVEEAQSYSVSLLRYCQSFPVSDIKPT